MQVPFSSRLLQRAGLHLSMASYAGGWWQGCSPGHPWALSGLSCLLLSSLLTTFRRCWALAKLPLSPGSGTFSGGPPEGASWTRTVPVWGVGGSPRVSAVSHGCRQGAPGPWAGGWTLVARSRAKRQGQAAWGGSQQQSGFQCLLVSQRPSPARPSGPLSCRL